jgi:hypothetical protein
MSQAATDILDRIQKRMLDGIPIRVKPVDFGDEFTGEQLEEAREWLGVMMAEYPPVYHVEIDVTKRRATITDQSVPTRQAQRSKPPTIGGFPTRLGW